ncbi:MAG: HAMP domain-containing sensor histidine kinase [Candidatus Eisenbacteria bacterium]
MRLSLRVQLGLAIVLVTLAVLALVLASSQRRLVEELYRFDGGGDTTVVTRAARTLEDWYPGHVRSSLTWTGADSVLAAVARPPGTELVLMSPAGFVVAASRADLRSAQILPGRPASDPDTTGADREHASSTTVVSYRDPDNGALVRLLFDAPRSRELHRADGRYTGRVYAFRFGLPPAPVRQRTLQAAARASRPGWLATPLGQRAPRRLNVVPEPPDAGRLRRVLVAPLLLGALASMVLLFLAASRALAPLRSLTDATRRLAAGDRAARARVGGSSEVADLAQSFNAMADSLERSEAVRRQMVSDVAHELRTPITNLRCRLEALQDGLASPDAAELRGLHDETLLLQRLVEDLQLLSLADAGRLRLQPGAEDLREIAAAAVTAFAAQAHAQGIMLTLAPGGPAPLTCDAMRIGQVLRNLLANALAHTPHGGGVQVVVDRADAQWRCSVRDTGSGIAPEQLPHVFERFWRADTARTREKGGAGLGLAIARQLVELHGGTLSAASVPGAGATFTMTLPSTGAA